MKKSGGLRVGRVRVSEVGDDIEDDDGDSREEEGGGGLVCMYEVGRGDIEVLEGWDFWGVYDDLEKDGAWSVLWVWRVLRVIELQFQG